MPVFFHAGGFYGFFCGLLRASAAIIRFSSASFCRVAKVCKGGLPKDVAVILEASGYGRDYRGSSFGARRSFYRSIFTYSAATIRVWGFDDEISCRRALVPQRIKRKRRGTR